MSEKISTSIQLDYGVKWQCKHCSFEQNYHENEEWQFHCNDTMRMIPWYRFIPVVTKELQP